MNSQYNFRCWYDKDFTQLSDVDEVNDLPAGLYYELFQYKPTSNWYISLLAIGSGGYKSYKFLEYCRESVPDKLFKVLPIDAQNALEEDKSD